MPNSYHLIYLLVVGVVCKNSQETKCNDGNLPLIDENRLLFPCQRGCPSTFFCENQPEISICCPNSTQIAESAVSEKEIDIESTVLRNRKDIQFQLESSAELKKSMSCERFPYKSSCENSTLQPQAKWYFDVQTLSCELYPLRMCEDDPLEELALRTRADCEQRCDVAKVRQALESLSERNSIENGQEVFHFNRFSQALPIAIDDVVQESKHARGRPFAIEPPTDLIHVIHTPSDTHVFRSLKNRPKIEDNEENELLTTDSSEKELVPTVTSDILEVLEDVNDDVLEGSGSGEHEMRLNVTVTEASQVLQNEERKKSSKEMEDSFERFYKSNRESVVCSGTAYKLLCSSGKPSQFVYRWELVNGICQSFPYGYCWKETNIAHPRTRAECEKFCK